MHTKFAFHVGRSLTPSWVGRNKRFPRVQVEKRKPNPILCSRYCKEVFWGHKYRKMLGYFAERKEEHLLGKKHCPLVRWSQVEIGSLTNGDMICLKRKRSRSGSDAYKLQNDTVVLSLHHKVVQKKCFGILHEKLLENRLITRQDDFVLCFLHGRSHFMSSLISTASLCSDSTWNAFLSHGELLVSHASSSRLAPDSDLMSLEQPDVVSAELLNCPSAFIFSFPLSDLRSEPPALQPVATMAG